MNKDIIITSYEHPDLDGFACTYAYSEFLNKKKTKTTPVLCGKIDQESKFVIIVISTGL